MSRKISATEMQRNIGAIVEEVVRGETVIVLSHGRPRVAIISAQEYDELREAWLYLVQMGDTGSRGPQS